MRLVSVLASHDNRSLPGAKDTRYGTLPAPYTLSNLRLTLENDFSEGALVKVGY